MAIKSIFKLNALSEDPSLFSSILVNGSELIVILDIGKCNAPGVFRHLHS